MPKAGGFKKPVAKSKKTLKEVENIVNGANDKKEIIDPDASIEFDKGARCGKVFNVPVNDYIAHLIEKAAQKKSNEAGVKVSKRQIANKLLVEKLEEYLQA